MADRAIIICTVVLAALYFYAISGIRVPQLGDPLGPRACPILIGIGLLLAAALLALESRRARIAGREASEVAPPAEPHHYPVLVGAIVATALYFALFERLGYPVATSLYLLAMTGYFNRGRWPANLFTSILFGLGSYYTFTELLGIRLPQGVWPF